MAYTWPTTSLICFAIFFSYRLRFWPISGLQTPFLGHDAEVAKGGAAMVADAKAQITAAEVRASIYEHSAQKAAAAAQAHPTDSRPPDHRNPHILACNNLLFCMDTRKL